MKQKLMKLILILILFCPLTCANAKVFHMERGEIIQRSKAIFTGSVESKQTRLNDQGNLIVTDYTFLVDEVLYGELNGEITLTFAGGQLGKVIHSLSDVPVFEVGEKVLLMLEDSDTPLFSPVTGVYQGKFVSKIAKKYKKAMAFDGKNSLIPNRNNRPFSFSEFVNEIKKEIPIAKSRKLLERMVAPENTTKVLKNLSAKMYGTTIPKKRPPITVPKANRIDLKGQNADTSSLEESSNYFSLNDTESANSNAEEPLGATNKNSPIIFDPLPTGAPLAGHDQEQMAYWNKYADIFRVVETPSETWAMGNNRNDIAGLVDSQMMIEQFGFSWGQGLLAICFITFAPSTGLIFETDIALNPLYNWTTDDYVAYRDPNIYNADFALLHELGHAWGQYIHNSQDLSVMNTIPNLGKYGAYTLLYGYDSRAIREAYPEEVATQTDLGVFLYYANGKWNWDDSTLSTRTITRDDSSLSVNNFILVNSGVNTVTTPAIKWYLVPNINSWTGAIYLTQTTYGTLGGDFYFQASQTIPIPDTIPPSTYYLAASIANSTDSIAENNSSWLDSPIFFPDDSFFSNIISIIID